LNQPARTANTPTTFGLCLTRLLLQGRRGLPMVSKRRTFRDCGCKTF